MDVKVQVSPTNVVELIVSRPLCLLLESATCRFSLAVVTCLITTFIVKKVSNHLVDWVRLLSRWSLVLLVDVVCSSDEYGDVSGCMFVFRCFRIWYNICDTITA